MRLDHAARLERLLARHPDVQLVAGAAGNGTLIRRDQLLAVSRDADRVGEQAARWIAGSEAGPEGVTVFHLRPAAKVDVCELTTSLSGGSKHKRVNAGPNHILTAAPGWEPGPFDDPTPFDAVPPSLAATGAGRRAVTVAILDTGIAEHAWFAGHAWFAKCGPDVREVPETTPDPAGDSVAGHGTFIAGVVLQQSPDANLVIGRIIKADGVTDELNLLHGLAALRHRADTAPVDVISLSLGCYTHDDRPSPVLEHGVNAFGPDTVVVACAGNADSDRPFWPAALKRVIAVGSLDTTGKDRAPFSNYGAWVDASTMGDQVVSSFFTYATTGSAGPERYNGFATWSGTSFAAPRVAGAIAALAAASGESARQAASKLLDPTTHRSMPDLGVLIDASASGA